MLLLRIWACFFFSWTQKIVSWVLTFPSLRLGAWDCFGYYRQAIGNLRPWRTTVLMAPITMMRRPTAWKSLLGCYLHIVKTRVDFRIYESFGGLSLNHFVPKLTQISAPELSHGTGVSTGRSCRQFSSLSLKISSVESKRSLYGVKFLALGKLIHLILQALCLLWMGHILLAVLVWLVFSSMLSYSQEFRVQTEQRSQPTLGALLEPDNTLISIPWNYTSSNKRGG